MPYNNPYNRAIAHTLGNINETYAHLYAYSPVDGRGGYALDGGSAGVLFQIGNASKRDGEDNIVNNNVQPLPEVYYYGNDEMKGGSGFAEATYRDRGDGFQEGVASGHYMKGHNDLHGGNFFGDIYDGFSDLGTDIGKAVEYLNPFGSGHPHHQDAKAKLLGRMLGKLMKQAHEMKGKGMAGGSWWDSLKEGVSDVVGFIPDLLIHGLGKKGGAISEVERKVGGAILGNPDPYPVKGDSERVAGRGRGRPKKVCCGCGNKKCKGCGMKGCMCKGCAMSGCGKEMVGNKQHDLLAMPNPILPNGVPPKAQLRGQYGGAKPKEEVMKAVAEKLKGGKNLSGMTDNRATATTATTATMMPVEGTVVGGKNLSGMTDKRGMAGDGRKKRAEIVKRIMKEKGMKMIEASKFVKEHGLYKP